MFGKVRTLIVGPGPSSDEENGVEKLNAPGPSTNLPLATDPDPDRQRFVMDLSESWIGGILPGPEFHKFPYSRPEFLYLTTEDEIAVSGDQTTRPILVPKDPLRMIAHTGYAETINSGKTLQNEDQAAAKLLSIFSKRSPDPPRKRREKRSSESASTETDKADEVEEKAHHSDDEQLLAAVEKLSTQKAEKRGSETLREQAVYFAICDGHAGTGAALMVSNCLHELIREKLASVLDLIIQQDRKEAIMADSISVGGSSSDFLATSGKSINRDSLVIGAIEAAFLEMDSQIDEEKMFWKISGGCAAIVALFLFGKVYIANAGDCRALLVSDDGEYRQMSRDHTPNAERKRLQQVAFTYPDICQKYYSRLEYSRHLTRRDVKKRVLYRDWYMDGWAHKTVKEIDLKPPLISSGPKKTRLLDTIGVVRGFGDHHLVTVDHNIPIKPFLSPVPEITVLDLRNSELGDLDMLILASDGLWDVLANDSVAEIVQNAIRNCPTDDLTKYTSAAQELVVHARGQPVGARGLQWRIPDPFEPDVFTVASSDDISVFVIPLRFAICPVNVDEDVEMLQ